MQPRNEIRSLVTVAVSFFLITGLAGTALAKPPGGGPGGPHGEHRMLDRYADELDLDAETRAAIEAIADSSKARVQVLSLETETARESLRTLLDQELPDEAAVMQQVEAMGAIDVARRKEFFQALIEIRKRLTPEQRKQLIALQSEHRSQRESMREELAESCELDVVTFCPDAEPRRERIMCMREHRDKLSPECRASIRTLKSKRERPHRDW
ncbi:MAG: periplasmic heavy metal sensor [Deltaproteobacteria bacterium]|nr:periplasmic heavy metal sensor [Deltaproteobacteria bacterium]MBW2418557.1 periplasmic heavy metal sensor [Deltaproteobacteria bacterium]